MNRILLIVGSLIILLLSCESKNEAIEIFNLSGKSKVFTQIINPEKIRVKNDFIVILESPSLDALNRPIHIVDRKKMKFLYSLGRIGFGPNEISDASSVEFNESDSTFSVYSSIDKKISKFSFKESESSISQLKQKNDFFKAYSVIGYTDSSFLALTVDSPSRFVEFNHKGESISLKGKNENFSERTDLDNFNLSQMNMGWFNSNDSKTHFAVASIFTNRIEIYDREKDSFNAVYLKPKDHTKFDLISESTGYSVHWDLNSPYHFRDVVLTESHVIALYGGYSSKEIKANSIIAKTVYIFSLNGKLEVKLNLDTSIRSIAVDKELKNLYGITTDADPGIIEFELPNMFKKY
jgi:hypothetical protein